MPLFGKRTDGVGGRRSAHREPVLLRASVFTLERSWCATVVDVSTTGARLRGCPQLERGEDLWIKVGVVDSLATVAWFEDDLCGINFDGPLSDEDVRHLRAEARNTLIMRLTPEERLAAQEWMSMFGQ